MMKQFIEPEIEIQKIEPMDIICESVNYDSNYYDSRDDFLGWG